MEYIDTHAHLYLKQFEKDVNDVVDRALKQGVKHLLLPNIDVESVQPMMKLAEKFSGTCLPMMALHPTSVNRYYQQDLEKIKKHLFSNTYIAVGETGIDLYWDKTFLKEQTYSFEQHLQWSVELNLPVVIHSRKSLPQIFDVINTSFKQESIKGVFHCFPGDITQAEKAIEKGFFIGIGGVVTYKNSEMSKLVKELPLKHIVLETDSPYLPPVPYRGKRNESAYIKHVAAKIAEIKNITIEEVASVTTGNAKMIFNID